MANYQMWLLYLGLFVVCHSHPLEDYVLRPDPIYTFNEVNRTYHEGVTTLIINMTSQTWMDETFSSQPVWFHYLVMAVPDTAIISDQAFVFVGIGNIDDEAPDPETYVFASLMRDFSLSTGAVSCTVSNIPNQPISFPSDGIDRTEDAIIARTWAIYMNETEQNRNPDVLLFFPMTKAIVRAMDTITTVVADENPAFAIDKFCVGGPSKRGFTTYLTGAVDDRVVGIAPMVISMLNLVPNLHHQYQSLGGWSWAFQDYFYEGLTGRLDSPEVVALTLMQDPYEMRANLTMPKYIIKAGNDEFFMLDDFQFFYHDLPGVTNMLILEDVMHIMLPQWDRLLATVATWFVNVHQGIDREFMTWDVQSGNVSSSVTVTLNEPAVNVTGWFSHTVQSERRDWRWLVLDEDGNTTTSGINWDPIEVTDLGNNQYQLTMDAPAEGYTGFFITVAFDGVNEGTYLELSTEPAIVPNTFAFPDCSGAECQGSLV